ncbi:MAG: hypothetical protein QQN53_08235, partial [Nitrosopumilus sp.]
MRAFVIPVIVSILILGGLGFSDAFAVGGTISDQTSCEAIGGTWISPNTCQITGTLSIPHLQTLTVNSGIILEITSTGALNIISLGALNIIGTINNSGTITNVLGGTINN